MCALPSKEDIIKRGGDVDYLPLADNSIAA
jgi:hypothetical protein